MAALALFAVTSQAQIVINEVMADNRGAVENGPDNPDYIELHNTSASAVDVGGMSVTDDPSQPQKFVIPAGRTIPAGGYLVLWCDSNNSSPGLHTGFGLGSSGDRVQLYAANGITLRDDVSFGISVANLSFGRTPNGSGSWTLNHPTPGAANVAQPLGSHSQLRLNEWMASPSRGEDWVEVYNGDPLPISLGGLIITDSTGTPVNRPVPALSFIAGHGFVQFFASNLEETDADHLDFRLGASGETLTIYESNGADIIDRVTFGSQTSNTSQGRAPDGSDNIVFFPTGAATPKAPNQLEITNVVISEILSHTDPPLEDAIELQNVTGAAVDISHWWLSDAASDPKKFQIPAGTVLPPHGFKVFYQFQFDAGAKPFSLNSADGDEVFLSSGNSSGQLTGSQTSVRFGPLRNGVSAGRYRTTTGIDFVPLRLRTFGSDNPTTVAQFRTGTGLSNALPRIGPVVISEIHFAPPVGSGAGDDDEFIEFHNPTSTNAPLFDEDYPTNTWRVRDGVTFTFEQNINVPAGGYLVLVSFDPSVETLKLQDFKARFNVPASVRVLGPFSGRLNNAGETLQLLQPDHPELNGPNAGMVPYEIVEAIAYAAVTPWPTGGAGTGLSLHRIVPIDYGNEPTNWVAAMPTPGRGAVNDSDGDGLPNDWEVANGFDPNDPEDGLADTDGDGASNLAEYHAGTNPRSAQSAFKFASVNRSGGNVQLRFHAVAGKSYELQSREQLSAGEWTSITNVTAAATGEMTLTVPAAGSTRFYRMMLGNP